MRDCTDVVVFSTLCIIVFSIIVDIAYAWIDPRIRLQCRSAARQESSAFSACR